MGERRKVTPLGHGHATYVSPEEIVATFPLSSSMEGWKIGGVEIDPEGFFLTVWWVKTDPDAGPPRGIIESVEED